MAGIDHKEKKEVVNASSKPVDEPQVENQTKQSNAPGNFITCLQKSPKKILNISIGIDEAPMAVLPLNSSTKLDQEPNPFEQSFSDVAAEDKVKDKLKLPPVASITSPSPVLASSSNNNNNNNNTSNVIGGGILPKEVSNQFTWDTLRTGPLSPSMLQGPANPDEYYSSAVPKGNSQLAHPMSYSARSSFSTTSNDVQYPIKVEHQQNMYSHPLPPPSQQSKRTRQKSTSSVGRKRSMSQQADDDDFSMDSNESSQQSKTRRRSSAITNDSEEDIATAANGSSSRKKTKSNSKDPEDDEKRKNFLERNRIGKFIIRICPYTCIIDILLI